MFRLVSDFRSVSLSGYAVFCFTHKYFFTAPLSVHIVVCVNTSLPFDVSVEKRNKNFCMNEKN